MHHDAPDDGAAGNALATEQLDAFWAAVVANYPVFEEAARNRHVPAHDRRDVVHSVAVRVLDSYEGRADEFPTSESSYCSLLMQSLRNYALDCVGRKRVKVPVHRHWGEPIVLPLGGRRAPDRAFETVFGVLSPDIARDVADPEDPEEQPYKELVVDVIRKARKRLTPSLRDAVDAAEGLGRKRRVSARVLRVKVKSFDSRRQRGYEKLRKTLREMIDTGAIPADSRLRAKIEKLEAHRMARALLRAERRARSTNQQACDDENTASNGRKSPNRKRQRRSGKREGRSDKNKRSVRKKRKASGTSERPLDANDIAAGNGKLGSDKSESALDNGKTTLDSNHNAADGNESSPTESE